MYAIKLQVVLSQFLGKRTDLLAKVGYTSKTYDRVIDYYRCVINV